MVRTDGSIVGDAVEAEISRSMTTFWSLFHSLSAWFGQSRQQSIEPFSEPSHAFLQVSTSFELRICHRLDRKLWEGMTDEGANVIWESAERVIAALIRYSVLELGMDLEPMLLKMGVL